MGTAGADMAGVWFADGAAGDAGPLEGAACVGMGRSRWPSGIRYGLAAIDYFDDDVAGTGQMPPHLFSSPFGISVQDGIVDLIVACKGL